MSKEGENLAWREPCGLRNIDISKCRGSFHIHFCRLGGFWNDLIDPKGGQKTFPKPSSHKLIKKEAALRPAPPWGSNSGSISGSKTTPQRIVLNKLDRTLSVQALGCKIWQKKHWWEACFEDLWRLGVTMKGENQHNIQTLKTSVLHRRGCTFRCREYPAIAQRRHSAHATRVKSSKSGHVPGLRLTFECTLRHLGDLLDAHMP